ncbi:MAG: SMC-Scp complex subunit ScpB [Bacillota bacterium]|nr:SMC-Scp complex subunit ScpB [Bacillota bacterium]
MDRELEKKTVEALLFLSEEPVKTEKLAAVLSISADEADALVRELKADLTSAERGVQIFEAAGGYQMGTLPELAPYIERAFSEDVSSNLSTAALEALAIIAYKQPVTRIEIESIRGVRSEHVLENLLKRKLIRISGRKEGPGRPLLYNTTPDFLKYFGLKDLAELPSLEPGRENQLSLNIDQEKVSEEKLNETSS